MKTKKKNKKRASKRKRIVLKPFPKPEPEFFSEMYLGFPFTAQAMKEV